MNRCRKCTDEDLTLVRNKSCQRMRTRRKPPRTDNGHPEHSTVVDIGQGETRTRVPPKSGCVSGPLPPRLRKALASGYSRKGDQTHHNWEKRRKALPLCRWGECLCEKSVDFTKQLLELIGELSKIVGCKVNVEKSIIFLKTGDR